MGERRLHGGVLARATLGWGFGGAGAVADVGRVSQQGFTAHLIHQTVDLLLMDQREKDDEKIFRHEQQS